MSGKIITTIDVVLFTLVDDVLSVGVLRRLNPPYRGSLALPGGFVHPEDENSEDAAHRVLWEKLGLRTPYLEQLYTFSGKNRDPRGWSVSIAYYALIAEKLLICQPPQGLKLVPIGALPELPFDHAEIVAKGVERLRNKAAYSALPCYLLGDTFTLGELQKTYELVLGQSLDKGIFRKKIEAMEILEEAGVRRGLQHRPAKLFRVSDSSRIHCTDLSLR